MMVHLGILTNGRFTILEREVYVVEIKDLRAALDIVKIIKVDLQVERRLETHVEVEQALSCKVEREV
jgi:hypothetical protein